MECCSEDVTPFHAHLGHLYPVTNTLSSPPVQSTCPRERLHDAHPQNQWLAELLASFMPPEERTGGGAVAASAGERSGGGKLDDHLQLVWPSVGAVRTSTRGWKSGGCGAFLIQSGRTSARVARVASVATRRRTRPHEGLWCGASYFDSWFEVAPKHSKRCCAMSCSERVRNLGENSQPNPCREGVRLLQLSLE